MAVSHSRQADTSVRRLLFNTIIIPMAISQSLNMRPLFNIEFQGLSNYVIKNNKNNIPRVTYWHLKTKLPFL